MGNPKLASTDDALSDVGHESIVGNAELALPENGADECQIAKQTNGKVLGLIALADDNLERLITLYNNTDQIVDKNARVEIELSLKRKLTSMLAGDGQLSRETLRLLISLEREPIDSDGCVTRILYAACRDFDTVMWLWELFVHFSGGEVNPKSNEFLAKHLETYNGDEHALWEVYRKFGRGSRRAKFIESFINDIRRRHQLDDLESAKGNYGRLVEFAERHNGIIVGGELRASVDELLPSMIEACGGNLDRLLELYLQPLCRRPLVSGAVEAALPEEIAKYGGDFNKFAELRSKVPADFYGEIDKVVMGMCREDASKFLELAKSPLAEPLCRFVALNSNVLEKAGSIDIDVIKNLVKLSENQRVKNDEVVKTFLDMAIKGLIAKYIDFHRDDFEKLVGLYDVIDESERKKDLSTAIEKALSLALDQCAGDFTKLVDFWERIPEEMSRHFENQFIDAFGTAAPSLAVYCGNDIEKLRAVRRPVPASYDLNKAIDGIVKDAMKIVFESIISERGGSLDELAGLYEKYGDYLSLSAYKYEQRAAAMEAFGPAIPNLIPVLISQCQGDVKKLAALYHGIPSDFRSDSSGEAVLKAASDLIDPLVDKCSDDLGELAKLYESIPYDFRAESCDKIRERVKDLLPFAVDQCNGDVGELTRLYKEILKFDFSEELSRVVVRSIQVFIDGCANDFGKRVALYNLLSDEGKAVMKRLVETK